MVDIEPDEIKLELEYEALTIPGAVTIPCDITIPDHIIKYEDSDSCKGC